MDIHELINRHFESIGWDIEPHNLYDPIAYTLEAGGKRIRPTLVLMACRLFGGDVEKALMPATATEVFHNFTLLHDDVMDNADTRRKRMTVHKKWDVNTAILSGDAMMIKAYQFLENVPADKLPAALSLFSRTAIEVCEGQQYDVDFERRDDVTIEEYYRMIRLKTAVLLAGSLKLGAILADASADDADALYDFGIAIGIAFQLRDDYLDVYGDERTFGKKIGGDILCGKRTFLLINALKNGSVSQRQTICQLLKNGGIPAEEKIAAVTAIYDSLDMPKVCADAMEEYYSRAMQALSRITDKDDAEKAPFVEFARSLMGRTE